jgi:hypothetical protein
MRICTLMLWHERCKVELAKALIVGGEARRDWGMINIDTCCSWPQGQATQSQARVITLVMSAVSSVVMDDHGALVVMQ